MWKKVKSSKTISQDLNYCMCSNITPHICTCLKESLDMFEEPWFMPCPNLVQLSRLAAVDQVASHHNRLKWDCHICESESAKNSFSVCEIAANVKVKVQKNLFVLICFCEFAINLKVKVQKKCICVDMRLLDCHKCESAN